jgi:phosphomannomutase
MRKRRKYVFDVDGTLTPSRQKIDKEFAEIFWNFCTSNEVYLVTGSDRDKTREQLTYQILNSVELSFNCAGNEVWKKYELVRKNDWKAPESLLSFLENELRRSKFSPKTGKHIEQRNGMINFTIVGRNCTLLERKNYVEWDSKEDERNAVAERVRQAFPELDVFVGGETGLDIFEKGKGKVQCLEHIRTSNNDVIHYFGDQIFPGGNDYDIAMECDVHHRVKSWNETKEIIEILSEVK